MRLLCERRSVEFLQVPPEVTVELLQAEIVHFLHVVKEALLQNADGIFNGTLVLRLPHLGRENHCVVVLRPFCVVLVQLRLDPVPVRNDSLLAVVANDQGRDTSKIRQGVVVDLDPLRLLCGYHPLSVDVLRVRENGDEDHDLYDFSGEPIYQMKGLPGKVHFHLLANDSIEMQRLFVLLAPFGVILAKLPVGIEFQPIVPAHLGIPVPENDQRHVLPGRHFLFNGGVVRQFVAEISASECRSLPVDRFGDPVIRNSFREWEVKCRACFECPEKFIDTGFADSERFSDLPAAHAQCEMSGDDVFVI